MNVVPKLQIILVVGGVVLAGLYPSYPGAALVAGFLCALLLSVERRALSQRIARPLLGWAIVGLGLTVTIPVILQLSVEYLLVTLIAIGLAMSAALLLGRLLRIDMVTAALIGAGTAICGASAIVAVSTAVRAKSEQTSMALGVVLILNAVALALFPTLGAALELSPTVFAAWAGLSIHDTSSVVAAALAYAPEQVSYATTVKLARAVWILPLVYLCVRLLPTVDGERRGARLPWFLWGYLAAALLASVVTLPIEPASLTHGARMLFSMGLFLTGASVDTRALCKLGVKPLAIGVVLWGISASFALFWLLSA